jgi:hypothetical protein
MQIQVSFDDIVGKYKNQIADLNHEIIVLTAQVEKLVEQLKQHEEAEANRVKNAAAARSAAQNGSQKPVQLPSPAPPVPQLPKPPAELAGLAAEGE